MKYNKILLYMTALVACLLTGIAFGQDYLEGGNVVSSSGSGSVMGTSGDYLSPSMSNKYPSDWLEGGYVRSSDRSMVDAGIAGMVQWLDTPVPNFPWYSADLTFYKNPVAETTFSPFTQYYLTSGTPVVNGIISDPTAFDITNKAPSTVYYGAGVGLPYSQYAATVTSKTNDLWIQGATNWTQYVVSPAGTWLQLVAYAPVAGPAGFYETTQTDTTSSEYKTYQFNEGYNTMNFNADQVGRHMLYFVVNSQPSNVVVVDVLGEASTGSTSQIEHTMS